MKPGLAIPILLATATLMPGCADRKKSRHPAEIVQPAPVPPDSWPALALMELPALDGAKVSTITGDVVPPAQATEPVGHYEDHDRLVVAEFGTDITRASNDIFAYDLALEKWSHFSNPASPITFDSPAILATKDSLFVWGGFDSSLCGTASNGQIYDINARAWKKISAAGEPSARGQANIHFYQGQIILFGGMRQLGSGCTVSSESEAGSHLVDGGIYDPARDNWVPIPAIPLSIDEQRSDSRVVYSVLSGHIIYALLSEHRELNINHLWMFDLKSMEWSKRPVELRESLDQSFHALIKTSQGALVWQNSWRLPTDPQSLSRYEAPLIDFFKGQLQTAQKELKYQGAEAFIFPEAALPDDNYLVSMRQDFVSPITGYGIASLENGAVTKLKGIAGTQVKWKAAGRFLVGYFQDENSKIGLIAYDVKDEKYYRLPETTLKYRTLGSWQFHQGKLVAWGGFNATESRNPREWDHPGDGVLIELPVP